jgi:hypothetical protein
LTCLSPRAGVDNEQRNEINAEARQVRGDPPLQTAAVAR